MKMSESGPIPKTRKPNFTESETLMILEQVRTHRDILISKLQDSVTNERKKDIWARISEYINSKTRNVNRTSSDIRRRWKNMVCAARKEVARIKGLPPGSGPIPTPSDLSMQILEVNPEWQDFSSYSANGPDPALNSFMKVEIGDDGEDEDYITPSPVSKSPRPVSISKVGDNSISDEDVTSLNLTSYTDSNQSSSKRRRVNEIALHQDIMSLDRENLNLEREKINIEKEKLVVEKEQLAIERQKLGMEREKLAMEKEKMGMEKEKLTLEITYWKRKLLQITQNSYDAGD